MIDELKKEFEELCLGDDELTCDSCVLCGSKQCYYSETYLTEADYRYMIEELKKQKEDDCYGN